MLNLFTRLSVLPTQSWSVLIDNYFTNFIRPNDDGI